MFFYEGYICPVCNRKFQETDDIVACPECGAPHHRECWMKQGKCHFAADHGTPRQWKHPDQSSFSSPNNNFQGNPSSIASGNTKFCPNCGQSNPEYAEFCSRCGHNIPPIDWNSNQNGSQQYTPPGYNASPGQSSYRGSPYHRSYGEYAPFHMPTIDPYGGVPHDENIDGVTAEDIAAFVGSNSAYYIPRFLKMSRSSSRASWNWPAFLFPSYWLLYRKNYLIGSILLLFSVLQNFISSLIIGVYITPFLDTTSDITMFRSLNDMISNGSLNIYFIILALLGLANILIRIIFGIIGNSLYMRTSLTRISKIRNDLSHKQSLENPTAQLDYRRELASNGGVSLILVAIASGIAWLGQLLFQALFYI